VAIFSPDINDSSKPGKMVIEAWAGGVRKIEWNKGHKKRTKIYIGYIECTKEQREKFYNYIYSKIGVKYDYKAILGFLLRMNIESRKGLFCSEFAYEACKKASIDVLLRIKPYQVSPKLLYISPVVKCSEERIV